MSAAAWSYYVQCKAFNIAILIGFLSLVRRMEGRKKANSFTKKNSLKLGFHSALRNGG